MIRRYCAVSSCLIIVSERLSLKITEELDCWGINSNTVSDHSTTVQYTNIYNIVAIHEHHDCCFTSCKWWQDVAWLLSSNPCRGTHAALHFSLIYLLHMLCSASIPWDWGWGTVPLHIIMFPLVADDIRNICQIGLHYSMLYSLLLVDMKNCLTSCSTCKYETSASGYHVYVIDNACSHGFMVNNHPTWNHRTRVVIVNLQLYHAL